MDPSSARSGQLNQADQVPTEVWRLVCIQLLPTTIADSDNYASYSTLRSLSLTSKRLSAVAQSIIFQSPLFLAQKNFQHFLKIISEPTFSKIDLINELHVNLSGYLDERGTPARGLDEHWLAKVLPMVTLRSFSARGLTNNNLRNTLDSLVQLSSQSLLELEIRSHDDSSLNIKYLSRLRHFPNLVSLSLYGVNLPNILRKLPYAWDGEEPTFRLQRLSLSYCAIQPCLAGLLQSSVASLPGSYSMGSLTIVKLQDLVPNLVETLKCIASIPGSTQSITNLALNHFESFGYNSPGDVPATEEEEKNLTILAETLKEMRNIERIRFQVPPNRYAEKIVKIETLKKMSSLREIVVDVAESAVWTDGTELEKSGKKCWIVKKKS